MIKERFPPSPLRLRRAGRVWGFALRATTPQAGFKGSRVKGLNRGLKCKNPTFKNEKWGFIFINISGFMVGNRALSLDVFQKDF